MRKIVRWFVVAGLFIGVAFPVAAQYPVKPIRVVLPFPTGGIADTMVRIITQPLSQTLGQPVIIENKPGADGAIAGEAVARAAPDGYTLLHGANTGMVAVPLLRKVPPYDPVADFTSITLFGRFTFVLIAHPSVPAKTLAELIDYAHANPGKLNYATTSSTALLATEQLKLLGKLDMVHVPYKGDSLALPDLLNGRVHLMFIGSPTLAIPFIRIDKLRAIGILLDARSPLLPQVPTMSELGMPNLAIVPWAALFGPAKMPKDIVDRLSREVNAILNRPDVREQLNKNGLEPQGSTPEAMAAYLREQLVAWRTTIREAGIQSE
jgi:tripartite-type tricarboxylate transporter receptor subunit TctC